MKKNLLILLIPALLFAAEAEIHPALVYQLSSLSLDETIEAWVFFADRGFDSELQVEQELATFVAEMNSAQRTRRERERGAFDLADERDLPVNTEYLSAVEGLVMTLHGNSTIANAAIVTATEAQLHEVAELSFVRLLQPVAHSVTLGLGEMAPYLDYGDSAGQLEQIQVDELHALGYDGSGVTVLMLDTGFRTDHNAFANVDLVDEYDFVNDDDDVDNESGDHGDAWNHGTATWGTLGGYEDGVHYGPAYGASFLLAKTEDVAGETPIEEYYYELGIKWGEGLGAEVASSSLGYRWYPGDPDTPYEDLDGKTTVVALAVNWAVDNGMLVATAMGNDYHYDPDNPSLISPADCDRILSCGAVDSSGTIAPFSSNGPTADGRQKPEVCATGVDTHCPVASGTGDYSWSNGTSLSTPLVGGVLALLRQIAPSATVAEIRQVLMDTGTRHDNQDNIYGHGIVQALDAASELGFGSVEWGEFRADRNEDGAMLRWQLDGFDNGIGINLFRYDGDDNRLRLNSRLLASTARAWLDTTAPEESCYYRLELFDSGGEHYLSPSFVLSASNGAIPGATSSLGFCYPNPAAESVSFPFFLATPGRVELTVYDLAGRRVSTVAKVELTAGSHEITWQLDDALPAGVYLYTLTTPDHQATRRFVLSR
ncbi:S8 family peptidase [bacterium]|nr:S8 family peptidase [bacterium]